MWMRWHGMQCCLRTRLAVAPKSFAYSRMLSTSPPCRHLPLQAVLWPRRKQGSARR